MNGSNTRNASVSKPVVARTRSVVAFAESLEPRRLFAVTPDPGQTIDTAHNVGELTGARTFGDAVGPADTIDIYKFTLNRAGQFSGRLRAYSADAEIDLLRQEVDANGSPTSVTLVDFRVAKPADVDSGDFSANLQAGTYYIHIQTLGGATEYLSRMTVDYAGNTLGSPRDIGSVVHETYTDFVGDFGIPSLTDTVDVYKLKLDAFANVQFLLEHESEFSDPANFKTHLELITDLNNNQQIDNQELQASTTPGVAGTINYTLSGGNYFLRVVNDGNFQNYRLTVVADYAGTTGETGRNIGTLNSRLILRDFISNNVDFRDTYKFTLSGARPFTASWDSGTTISAQLFADTNKNGLADTGEFVTSTFDEGGKSIQRNLDAGGYLIQVDAVTGGTGKYTLVLDGTPPTTSPNVPPTVPPSVPPSVPPPATLPPAAQTPTATLGDDPGETGRQALIVIGTDGEDALVVGPGTKKSQVSILSGGVSLGEFTAKDFSRIYVDAKGGNDTLGVTTASKRSVVLIGGDGNDQITGGKGGEILLGNAGDDTLRGGKGKDVIFGGDGTDNLQGEASPDLLFDGGSSFENRLEAMLGVQAEWTTSRSAVKRVANLQSGGGRMQGRMLSGDAIAADNVSDTLQGGTAADAFFHHGVSATAGDLLDTLADKDVKEPAVDYTA